jgi:hypothetical protein
VALDWLLLTKLGLVWGGILTAALVVMMITSGLVAPDMWVGDYPPDIRAKYGPMSQRAARLRPYIAVLFFTTAIAIPLMGLFSRTIADQLTFLSAFAFSFIVLLVFNIVDLLILDWLLFCTIQPRLMVLPGTEGMAGYRDYRFHFIGFLKGFAFCAAGSLVITLLWLGIRSILA